jgi:hypothetical protein
VAAGGADNQAMGLKDANPPEAAVPAGAAGVLVGTAESASGAVPPELDAPVVLAELAAAVAAD